MCSQVKCTKCGKPTWAGCGQHIEQALANVPRAERCRCREAAAKPQAPGNAAPAPLRQLTGWWD